MKNNKVETAKNLYARPTDLELIKKECLQYASELFTMDDNSNTRPEDIKFYTAYNRVIVAVKNYYFNTFGEIDNIYTDVAYIVKCNKCGDFEIDVFDGDMVGQTQYCANCGLEFTQIEECKFIEW